MSCFEQGYAISHHAQKRCQQRGVPKGLLAALEAVGDRAVPVGGGRIAVSLSRNEAARLRHARQLAPAMLERLNRLTIIVSDGGEAVTVLHAANRRYRRAWN